MVMVVMMTVGFLNFASRHIINSPVAVHHSLKLWWETIVVDFVVLHVVIRGDSSWVMIISILFVSSHLNQNVLILITVVGISEWVVPSTEFLINTLTSLPM